MMLASCFENNIRKLLRNTTYKSHEYLCRVIEQDTGDRYVFDWWGEGGVAV